MSGTNKLETLVSRFSWKPEYQEALIHIAQNDDCDIEWNTLRQVISFKIIEISKEKRTTSTQTTKPETDTANTQSSQDAMEVSQNTNTGKCDDYDSEEAEERIDDECKDYQDRIGFCLSIFDSPPFTIQRICELLTQADRYYKSEHKFLRAIEKAVYVTSTVEDFPTTTDKPETDLQKNSGEDGEAGAGIRAEDRFLPLSPPKQQPTAFDAATSAVGRMDPNEPFPGDISEGFVPGSFQTVSDQNALSTSDIGVVRLSPTLDTSKISMLDPMAEGTGQMSPLSPSAQSPRSNGSSSPSLAGKETKEESREVHNVTQDLKQVNVEPKEEDGKSYQKEPLTKPANEP